MARRIAERLPDGRPRATSSRSTATSSPRSRSATVATSAWEAREYLFLTEADPITADPDRQWADAAATARALADAGYRPPGETRIPVLGRRGIAAAEAL